MPEPGTTAADEEAQKRQDLISAQIDESLTSQSARFANMDSRAGLLTGAASILGTVAASRGFTLILTDINVFIAAVAAAIGLSVAAPYWGRGINLEKMRASLEKRDPLDGQKRLANEKVALFNEREKILRGRAYRISWGYVVLAVSVLASLLLSVFGVSTKS